MAGRNLFAESEPVNAPDDKGRDLFADVPVAQPDQSQGFVPQPFAVKEDDGQSFAGGAGQSLLQGATLGFSDEIQSVIAAAVSAPFISDKTFGQLMTDARASFREDQEKFREENPKTALGLEVAGGITTGGIGLTRLGAVKTGALFGATFGAGASDQDEFLSLNTAIDTAKGATIGAAGGVIIPKALNAVSQGVKRLFNKPQLQVFDDAGKFTDEAIDEIENLVKSGKISGDDAAAIVNEASKNGGVLTPKQVDRFNLFKSRGVTPLKADITQKTDDFISQQSAAKRTGPVSETIAKQDEQLTGLVQDGIDTIKPIANNMLETNASIFRVVDDVVTSMDSEITKAYQLAKTVAKGQPRVTFDNLIKSVNDNRGKEKISGGVISALRGVLKNKGLLKKGVIVDINKRGSRSSGDDIKKLTVSEAEEIRQSLNGLFDSVTPQGRRLIRELKNALDDDVASAVGEDIFRGARNAKIKFQETIERGARNKFDKTRRSFLEDIIDNKIPEEKIVSKLLSGRDDDLIKMKQFLTKDAGEAGVQSWNEIRAQVLRGALDKALGTQGKREGGQAIFNVRLFKNELNKLRNSKKFKELFNTDEIKLIDDIVEIGNLRIPQANVQQGRGPTELAVNELRKAIFRKVPLIGERATDLFDAVSNLKGDRRLLDFTRETESALRR